MASTAIVLAIPLLFEADMTDLVSEIWTVTCSPEQQLARLQARNTLTREEALARIASQMPLQEKCDRADMVIDNSLNLAELYRQLDCALTQGPASI